MGHVKRACCLCAFALSNLELCPEASMSIMQLKALNSRFNAELLSIHMKSEPWDLRRLQKDTFSQDQAMSASQEEAQSDSYDLVEPRSLISFLSDVGVRLVRLEYLGLSLPTVLWAIPTN